MAIILVLGHWGRWRSTVLAIILVLGALGEEAFDSFGSYFGLGALGQEVFNSFGSYFGFGSCCGSTLAPASSEQAPTRKSIFRATPDSPLCAPLLFVLSFERLARFLLVVFWGRSRRVAVFCA